MSTGNAYQTEEEKAQRLWPCPWQSADRKRCGWALVLTRPAGHRNFSSSERCGGFWSSASEKQPRLHTGLLWPLRGDGTRCRGHIQGPRGSWSWRVGLRKAAWFGRGEHGRVGRNRTYCEVFGLERSSGAICHGVGEQQGAPRLAGGEGILLALSSRGWNAKENPTSWKGRLRTRTTEYRFPQHQWEMNISGELFETAALGEGTSGALSEPPLSATSSIPRTYSRCSKSLEVVLRRNNKTSYIPDWVT